MVQWWRLHISNSGGLCWIPSQGAKISQTAKPRGKKKKKANDLSPVICNVLKSPTFSHFLLLLLQYELLRRNYHLDPMGISVWVEERSWKWGAEMFTEAAKVVTSTLFMFLISWLVSFCHVHCDCGADVVGFWAAASKMFLGYLLTHIKIMALLGGAREILFTFVKYCLMWVRY